MCGRYAAGNDPAMIAMEFDSVNEVGEFPADFNIAPTRHVPVVLERVIDDAVVRKLRLAHWGLVPSWAKDRTMGARMNNARAETIHEKPSFRTAIAKRRLLVPADGYYEWQAGTPKQPYFISAADGQTLAMAGIYEWWQDKTLPREDPAAWLLSFSIITRPPDANLAFIHDRMPVMIAPADRDRWLDPAETVVDDLIPVDRPGSVPLVARKVSRDVGNVRNNGPALVAEVE